jgi:hypothetical protein
VFLILAIDPPGEMADLEGRFVAAVAFEENVVLEGRGAAIIDTGMRSP